MSNRSRWLIVVFKPSVSVLIFFFYPVILSTEESIKISYYEIFCQFLLRVY